MNQVQDSYIVDLKESGEQSATCHDCGRNVNTESKEFIEDWIEGVDHVNGIQRNLVLCGSCSYNEKAVLELGAGEDTFSDDPVCLDVHDYPDTDVVFDLEKLAEKREQLPFPNRSFDRVRAKQVLEHIEHVEAVFEEVYRVLRNGGKFVVEVPHAQSPNAFSEMGVTGHCQFFNEEALLHFGENEWGIQNKRMDCSFQVEKVRTFYNWETGFAPNPVRFWKPERIEAVYVKSEEDVAGYLCDAFWKSFLFKVINE